jgi:hypothetical protein
MQVLFWLLFQALCALICAGTKFAIQIKSADVIAKKYATRGGQAGPDYLAGVNNPRQDWQAATASASNTWGAGVQQAVANGSFVKGVNAAGSAKWQRKAAGVGATRYPSGVTAAQGDYQNGVSPYLQVIAGLTLPPRNPKGDPSNIQRVAVIAAALRAKKLSG